MYLPHLMLVLLFSHELGTGQASESAEEQRNPAASARALGAGPGGIVVPKRSALIMGLNQQFKLRNQQKEQEKLLLLLSSSSTSSQSPPGGDMQPEASTASAPSKATAGGLFAPINWLASRSQQRRHQQQQQQALIQSSNNHQNQQQAAAPQHPTPLPVQALYLDRYQQQILAANPALLNPESQTNLTNLALLTRSDAALQGIAFIDPSSTAHLTSGSYQQTSGNLTLNRANSNQFLANTNYQTNGDSSSNGRQLYRGFSLIELEVKSESDRRYVQDLYGNLSAAVNEQAANPNSPSVSPYVDVDFWSLKYGLNDRIDIMVSPKSRAFILSQLLRSRIRHRIKIDDIQARLDQQSASATNNNNQTQSQAATSGNLPQLSASGRENPNDTPLSARQAAEQRIAARQAPESLVSAANKPLNESAFFEDYQRVADINQWLEALVEKNRDVARVKVIGRSSQGRYLRVLKLGYEQETGGWTPPERNDLNDNLPGRQPSALDNASYILDSFFKRQSETRQLGSIWLDGGTHAREWISPATVLYIAHRLADNHNKCQHFFDSLTQLVAVGKQSASLVELDLTGGSISGKNGDKPLEGRREERRYGSYNETATATDFDLHSHLHLTSPVTANLQPIKPPPLAANLDPSLLPSINEINTSLLGKPVAQVRPRTELERTMEQLAKNPRELAFGQNCDLDLDQLLRRYTFYLMPVLNPDGYEYSHTHNRLWRKTRSTSNHPIYRHFCLGADPNRNYDARHGQTGSSTHPCSQTYAGTVPFTEPETKHQSNFVYANRLNMKMFISFHSYSQMILLPFSHSKQLAPDHKDLESVGQAAVKAIERTHGTVYRVGPSASILYTASGTASDWAYEKAGIKYSYTIELRDTGAYGFLLPRQQIVPTGEETFNGLLAMIEQMEKNDNLLTSKSQNSFPQNKPATNFPEVVATLSPASESAPQTQTPQSSNNPELVDTNHVPDTDHLKPLSSQAVRAPLENILDSGASWASAEHPFAGVRDRRPPASMAGGESAIISRRQSYGGADSAQDLQHAPRDDENVANDSEPDAGYAFEGEGDLMEPTSGELKENAILREAAEMRMTGRRDHSRRIVQAAGLTSSGRSFINSPLLQSRVELASQAPKRRESSESLLANNPNY